MVMYTSMFLLSLSYYDNIPFHKLACSGYKMENRRACLHTVKADMLLLETHPTLYCHYTVCGLPEMQKPPVQNFNVDSLKCNIATMITPPSSFHHKVSQVFDLISSFTPQNFRHSALECNQKIKIGTSYIWLM